MLHGLHIHVFESVTVSMLLIRALHPPILLNKSTILTHLLLPYIVFDPHVMIWSSIAQVEKLNFRVTEEASIGTVIASGAMLGSLALDFRDKSEPRILNQNDPGVSSLAFHKDISQGSSTTAPNLRLVVVARIDREQICPNKDASISLSETMMNKFEFRIEPTASNFLNTLGHGSDDVVSQTRTDCIIPLRVAATGGVHHTENVEQIYHMNVYVQDLNDNAPIWTDKTIVLSFRDGDPAGTSRSIPLATDADTGPNSFIAYQLQERKYPSTMSNTYQVHQKSIQTSLPATKFFELTKGSGSDGQSDNALLLTAKYNIDRESYPNGWALRILAANTEGPKLLTGELHVIINITDINDNIPIFSQTVYQPQLSNQKVGIMPENTPVGTVLVRLHATDQDEGSNADIRYSFVPGPMQETIQHFFEITKDGELCVRRPIQVDSKLTQSTFTLPTSTITFAVQAVDSTDPAYANTGTASVKLKIDDIDDEAPEIKVHPIHPWTGSLSESSRKETVAELAIMENQPPGRLLGLIEVTDPDNHSNEMLRCNLRQKDNSLFQLRQHDMTNSQYSLHSAEQLDREKMSRIVIHVDCQDLAQHTKSVGIGINILDMNDHAPKFTETIYQFSVQENDRERVDKVNKSSNKTWITSTGMAFVKAEDKDLRINGKIEYKLEDLTTTSGKGLFSVDPSTGQLFAWGPFDREQTDSHRFIVVALDGGDPPLSGSCIVQVTVTDVNDNAPVFPDHMGANGGYVFSVKENQQPGTRIGQVEAYDPDLITHSANDHFLQPTNMGSKAIKPLQIRMKTFKKGLSKLTFSLSEEKDAWAFWIDSKTGIIITRSLLDREAQSTYSFHVIVSDGPGRGRGHLSASAETDAGLSPPYQPPDTRSHLSSILVTVTVTDENDNDPIFVRPNSTNHMVFLDPSAVPGQSLLQLLAEDPDEGLNSQVTYAIHGGNSGNLFNVDYRTGLLYLSEKIPLSMIAEATAVVVKSVSRDGQQDTGHPNQGTRSEELSISSAYVPSTRPTYLLALEACDQGTPRRCTTFPNLQIQLRVYSEFTSDSSNKEQFGKYGLGLPGSMDLSGLSGTNNLIHSPASQPILVFGSSIAKLTIIILSAFFAILLVAIVVTICVLRQRAHHMLTPVEQKAQNQPKRNRRNPNNSVEMLDQAKTNTLCSSNQFTSTHKGYPQEELFGLTSSPHNHPLTLLRRPGAPVGYSNETISFILGDKCRAEAFYTPGAFESDAGTFNRKNTSSADPIPEDYQALENWDSPRLHLYPPHLMPDATFIDENSAITNGSNHFMNHDHNLQKNYGKGHLMEFTDEDLDAMEAEKHTFLAPDRQMQSSLSLSVGEGTVLSSVASTTNSFNPRSPPKTINASVKAYAGFPKSSFV